MPDWALMVAGDKGDVTEVLALLARGARVDTHDEDGSTSIHHAVRRGHHACVMVLARAGVDVDAVAGPRRRTALHEATASGSIEMIRALLLAGSSVRVADAFGETPLHLVARVDPARAGGLAPLLLASGADPRAADARGFTAAHAAAAADRLTLLRDVAPVSSMTDVTPFGETAFDTAMRYEHALAADLLLRSGAKPRGLVLPPLHDAARVDAADRVALLLAAGADPLGAFEGKTALDVAVEHGSRRAAPLLRQAARVP